jgi:8-amino-7-oxononanoate synthase
MTLKYIDHFNHLLGDLEQQSLKRTLKICDSASAPVMTIDGQAMLTFCSNDYLGSNHSND